MDFCCLSSRPGVRGLFSGNSANGEGGGVCAEPGSNVDISGNTTFSGNSANGEGGGVCTEPGSNVKINGNTTLLVTQLWMVEESLQNPIAM